MMDKDDMTVIKRFSDLSLQADRKGIVVFSDFLNLNEISLLHQCKSELSSDFVMFGGYDNAERQMVAFQPDALYYNREFPISCIRYTPVNLKFAEQLTHRDVLGALMNLGIERCKLGDILLSDEDIYVFCVEALSDYIKDELYKIRHTQVRGTVVELREFSYEQKFQSGLCMISSNRLDAFVSSACKLSRAKASEYILSENVFINGKMISNHNAKLCEGDILSLRKYGRLVISEIGSLTKKGRLRISYQWYL